jgi:hypothetical protein
MSTNTQRIALMQEELEKGKVYVLVHHDEFGNLRIKLPFDRRTDKIPARARHAVNDFEAMLAKLNVHLEDQRRPVPSRAD